MANVLISVSRDLGLLSPPDKLTKTISSTKPLQLIRQPMVKLSRQRSLLARAARVPPAILPTKAHTMMPMT